MDAVLRYWNFDGVPGSDGTVCTWQLNVGVSIFVHKANRTATTPWLEHQNKSLKVRALFEFERRATGDHVMSVTLLVHNGTGLPLQCDGITKLWNPVLQTLEEARFLGALGGGGSNLSAFSATLRCPLGSHNLNEDPFSCNMYLIVGLYPEKSIGLLECQKPLADPKLSRDFTDFTLVVEDAASVYAPSIPRSIPVHRVVLAANSAVFAAMFEAEMKESRDMTTLIEGYSFETVELFVDILYSRTKFPESADFR